MGQSPDSKDGRREAHPGGTDEPSFITASVGVPVVYEPVGEEETERIPGAPPIPKEEETAQVSVNRGIPIDSATALASQQLPPDGDTATLPAREVPTRSRVGSAPEITTAHGLTHGPRSTQPLDGVVPPPKLHGDWDEGSGESLITPRFAPNALVDAELAFADTAYADSKRGIVVVNALPADDEPDTAEFSGTLPAFVATGADTEDRTMPKGGSVRDSAAHDDPPTLDPPHSDESASESDHTVPKMVQPGLAVVAADPRVVLPPMRPRLDSEAAGEWAMPEDARAAMLDGIASPISSDTAALPRPAVEDPLAKALRSQIEASLAKTQQALTSPHGRPITQQLESAPGLPSAPISLQVGPPSFPSTPRVQVERLAGPDATAVPTATSSRHSLPPGERTLSPVTVFFVTFFVVGGLLGGAVALQHFGWFGFFRPKTVVNAPQPPVVDPGVTSTADVSDTSSAPSAIPSASVPPASSSGTRPKRPKPTRPRHP